MSKASDDPISRDEVIAPVRRRRRWSTTEQVRLVEEAMRPGMSVSLLARRAGVSPSQLFAWKRRMLEGGHAAVQADAYGPYLCLRASAKPAACLLPEG